MIYYKKCLYCYRELKTGEIDFHSRCSKDFFGTPDQPRLDYTLDEMSELAKNVIESSVSVPGVQPKLSLGFIQDVLDTGKRGRLTVVGALGGNYILKPQNSYFVEMPENEHLTMMLAGSFGITTVDSSLIRLQSGELSYITKRIDRLADGKQTHMLDMFQILEAFDKYKGSMEKIGKAVLKYSENTMLDAYRLFELTLFSFITCNNDMHLKNFSMICRANGWVLSPAYDLLNVWLHIPEDIEELALTLNGKKQKLSISDFEGYGQNLGLNKKQINNTFKRFQKAVPKWKNIVGQSFLSEGLQNKYADSLESRYNVLFEG